MSKRYRYRDRGDEDAESAERRWQKLYAWPEALHAAYHYDGTKLSAYLRQSAKGELDPLDQTQLNELAKLIDRRIHRNKSGRKKGRIPPLDPDKITVDYVARLARDEMQRMKRENDGKTPRGAVPIAIHTVCQWLGDAGYNVCIDMDDVRAFMLKRSKLKLKRKATATEA